MALRFGFASLFFSFVLVQPSLGSEGRNWRDGLNGLGGCLFFFSVKLFHCVGERWLLSSFVKGHILVSVSVAKMAHEASGNVAGGTTPSVAWIYLLEDDSDWWMSKLFISCSSAGQSISRAHGLLKGQKRVHSSLMKPQYLPNSYLLKRLECKNNVVWKIEIVLSKVFCRFPAENIICRINKTIELHG